VQGEVICEVICKGLHGAGPDLLAHTQGLDKLDSGYQQYVRTTPTHHYIKVFLSIHSLHNTRHIKGSGWRALHCIRRCYQEVCRRHLFEGGYGPLLRGRGVTGPPRTPFWAERNPPVCLPYLPFGRKKEARVRFSTRYLGALGVFSSAQVDAFASRPCGAGRRTPYMTRSGGDHIPPKSP